MKIDRLALIRALKTAAPIIERRSTIPILSTALISAADKLTIETTDLDLALRVSLDYEGGAFAYCQSAPASLIPLLKAADTDTVSLEQDANKVQHLNAGSLRAKLGHGLPAADWPELASGIDAWTAMIGSDFMDKLKRVSLAMSTEETRYYLNGVYFHHVDGWTYRLVATDGHRLIYANVEMPDAPDPAGLKHMGGGSGSKGIILPRKAVATLMSLHASRRSEPVRFALAAAAKSNDKPGAADLASSPATKARFEIGDTVMLTKLIDGTFPDYTRVIPQGGKHVAELATADMRKAVGALVGFVPERARATKLEFKGGTLTLTANNIEMGAEVRLAVPAKISGGDFQVGFNGRYLLAQLSAAGGETVRFEADDAAAPTLFYDPTSTDVRTVLMPMRIG